MMKIFALVCLAGLLIGCSNVKDNAIRYANECYEERLQKLRATIGYNQVLSEFLDTFNILVKNNKNFGPVDFFEYQVDDAIFFSEDSTECLLLVLERDVGTPRKFGAARIIRGQKHLARWDFRLAMKFFFETDYFGLFKENTFKNISQLARYEVLNKGDLRRRIGCELDQEYWF